MEEWYNTKLCEKMNSEFSKKFRSYDLEKLLDIAKSGDLYDFRLLCNALYNNHYDIAETIKSYENIKLLKDACNNRVNKILGELLPYYTLLDSLRKNQYWSGDERYSLYSCCIPTYEYAELIQSTLILYHDHIGKPLSIENAVEVSKIISGKSSISRNLYPEKGLYSDEYTFKEKNFDRKLNTEAWFEFMNEIFYKDYDKAYKVREKYSLLYEKNSKKG